MPNSKLWRILARRTITTYYLNNQLCQPSSNELENAVARTMDAFVSERYFSRFDALLALLYTETGASTLQGKTIMLLGSSWGFCALHLMETFRPQTIIAVDAIGAYWQAGAAIVEEMPEYFQGVQIVNPHKTDLKKYKETADYLIIASPFYTVNNEHERTYLATIALQTTKMSGGAAIFVNKKLGMIPAQTMKSVVSAAGFSNVYCLDSKFAQSNQSPSADDKAHYIIGISKQEISTEKIREHFVTLELDAHTAIARANISEIKDETNGTRLQQVINDIKARNVIMTALPTDITIVQSNACNLRCVFCNVPDTLYPRQLSETLLHDITLNFKGFTSVCISGGEPLLHEKNFEILKLAEKHPDVYCMMISNMNVRKAGLMQLVSQSLNVVSCSMDAANAKTYETLRYGGKFDLVIKNLAELVQLRADNMFPIIQISFIVTSFNYKEIPDIVALCNDMNYDEVYLRQLVWVHNERSIGNLVIDFSDDSIATDVIECIIRANDYAEKNNIGFNCKTVLGCIIAERPDLALRYDLYSYLNSTILTKKNKRTINNKHSTCSDEAKYVQNTNTHNLPCIAPFTSFSSYASNDALFCCNCQRKYMSIPIDVSKGLQECFNAPLFMEARQHFYDGNFHEVCLPSCPFYTAYKNKNTHA
ncbi:MAG: radical SAM protein [Desulfovibrionaceae bacterium]